ncbi:MAG TPA: UDP-N-acetylglucosamine--N-acetylmuramyl-(pentapeptide) pyrophosphoryl-undecaprenol N-acetylglucosamine transferase [Gemmatimonadales bacterium]|nr:UDP-N-acetylglucosamine--N-acetylmuramyl-(pentapeptide) pyrophosphoryl-undecaprenol N-acetylglucosamine transferase [Gemmatimonadales bacterium]
MRTIVFAGGGTGGHLFPALAIGRAIRAIDPGVRQVHAGAVRGVEATILPARGVPHRLFPFQPLHRRQWWRNLAWPGLARTLVREIDGWLDDIVPDLVIGTGGYVSAPVVWRAARRRIPTAILELDVRPGLATRLVASWVTEIWLATEASRAGLPAKARARAHLTGAPILPPDPERRSEARARFGFDPDRPVLIVTGGSQGSLALNRAVAAWLDGGGGDGLQVIWATGPRTHAEFAARHQPPFRHVLDFIDPMADAWAVADLALTRAGRMTLAEVTAWGIPAILVPLPSAAADHQTPNARAAQAAGYAVHLPQRELTPARLETEISAILGDPVRREAMRVAARRAALPDAAIVLARRALALIMPAYESM